MEFLNPLPGGKSLGLTHSFFILSLRNIGLEEPNVHILSAYTFLDSEHPYEIDDDSSKYCQSTMKSLTVGQKQICLLHADHMPVVIQGKDAVDRPDGFVKASRVTGKRRRTQLCKRLQMRRMNSTPTQTGSFVNVSLVLLQVRARASKNANINCRTATGIVRWYVTVLSLDQYSIRVGKDD